MRRLNVEYGLCGKVDVGWGKMVLTPVLGCITRPGKGKSQPVKVSRWCKGKDKDSARWKRGPTATRLRPRPAGFPGRTRTSIDSMREGLDLWRACRAEREAQLKLSEPQKRMRRGSDS